MENVVYSVVVPVYNSVQSLPDLVRRVATVFSEQVKESFEIVFVDDFSPNPDTWPMLVRLSGENDNVHAFRLARNFGKPGALTCGLSRARGHWVITMDDDLQHQPEDIPKLLTMQDHDVVVARFANKNCGRLKKMASDLKGVCDIYLLGKPRDLANSPFKLIKRHVVRAMIRMKTPRPFITAQILTITADLVNVDVPHKTRIYGRSQYTLRKSISQFSNLLFNNSSFMLRLMSFMGFSLSMLSLLLGVYFLLRKFWMHHVVAGWTALMVVLLGATGMILFCLGILGEYVSRLISSSENHPAFVLREEATPEKIVDSSI